MTKIMNASVASSTSTTGSGFPDSLHRTLAPVPETRGAAVIVLAPVTVTPPLPDGFEDIDLLVERAEQDPVAKQAIAAGRRAVAEDYYSQGPRTLSYYRLRKGWSQKALAAQLGTSQSYIARLEAGSIDPQVSTLQRLAAALEIQPTDVLEAITSRAGRS
jgi:DNA-binding Xre family transcriptional regulator